MPDIIQAIRGMNDILPPETLLWQHVELVLRRLLQGYGYQEIRFPIVEKTELFKRTIGEATDIVAKEMYTFLDRNDDSLSLRPEGTACFVRAAIEHGLLHNQTQRLWFMGPCFRHERPQKGRYRQFYQCGAEVFGLPGPDIDAEMILMTENMLDKLGIKPFATLQINSLGSPESRAAYRKVLVNYFSKHKSKLDEDSLNRLHINPLRILDSKNPHMKDLIADAPKLVAHLDEDSAAHFEKLLEYLSHAGLSYEINPNLVRGLDYYTKTVFEWVTDKLGSQSTICAGGRYDSLVEKLGGQATPALGFGMGLERVIALIEQSKPTHKIEPGLHAYFITDSDASFKAALKTADYLRSKTPGLKLLLHCGGGSLKNQFKKADKSGAQFAIILGEHEMKTHTVSVKPLREDVPQQSLYQDELAEYLKLRVSGK